MQFHEIQTLAATIEMSCELHLRMIFDDKNNEYTIPVYIIIGTSQENTEIISVGASREAALTQAYKRIVSLRGNNE